MYSRNAMIVKSIPCREFCTGIHVKLSGLSLSVNPLRICYNHERIRSASSRPTTGRMVNLLEEA